MARRNRRQSANRESDDFEVDPFIALRHWGGWRGWAAWFVAHTLAFALVIAGWILVMFLGVQFNKLPSLNPIQVPADFERTSFHLLPVAVATILVAHSLMVLLLRSCRPHIARFAYTVYKQAERKEEWRAERARSKRGKMTFRQVKERSRLQTRRFLGVIIFAAAAGTVLVWHWWTWPWDAGLSVGHRAEIVGLGALAGSALVAAALIGAFAALLGIALLGWLLLALDRWIGQGYMSWLIDRRLIPPDKPATDTEAPSNEEPSLSPNVRPARISTRTRPSVTTSSIDTAKLQAPSLGLLAWLSAGDLLPYRRLFTRSAPIPCSSRRVPLNRIAAYIIAADVHEMEQRGHIHISIERRSRWQSSLVRPHRLVRHGRGLRIQQQLYNSPIIDLDARIDDDLTGRTGDLPAMREQLHTWIGAESEDPHWTIMSQVLDEACLLGLIRPADVQPRSGPDQPPNYKWYEWVTLRVSDAVREGATRHRKWLDTLASKSREGDVTRHAVRLYRRDLRKIRRMPEAELPEAEDSPLMGTILLLMSLVQRLMFFVQRRRRSWPMNDANDAGSPALGEKAC